MPVFTKLKSKNRALVTCLGMVSRKLLTFPGLTHLFPAEVRMLEAIVQDLRYAWRTLWKSPGFTLIALLTLALGIGANSAIFSVINAALLQPLPYPHPDQLVLLFERGVVNVGTRNPVSLANFLDWQAQNHSFIAMAAERRNAFNLAGEERGVEPERVSGAICSWSLFPTLGVSPLIGRPFTADEDKPGAKPVAVISYGLWQRRFAGSAEILQRKLRLDSIQYDIVGVMPRGFAFPDRQTEIWTGRFAHPPESRSIRRRPDRLCPSDWAACIRSP